MKGTFIRVRFFTVLENIQLLYIFSRFKQTPIQRTQCAAPVGDNKVPISVEIWSVLSISVGPAGIGSMLQTVYDTTNLSPGTPRHPTSSRQLLCKVQYLKLGASVRKTIIWSFRKLIFETQKMTITKGHFNTLVPLFEGHPFCNEKVSL